MKETKIKDVSMLEFVAVVLPIFVITLVGVFVIKVFYQIILVNWSIILMASCFSFMLIHMGGLGIYRFWRR